VEEALVDPNGLLAAGGSLSVERLVDAYAQGIFPWFNPGDPVLWWSPDPRMVLFVRELRVSRSLARRLRKRDYRVTADRAFAEVVRACAAPRPHEHGTWIVPAMMRAYERLHEVGLAHSIEVWMDGSRQSPLDVARGDPARAQKSQRVEGSAAGSRDSDGSPPSPADGALGELVGGLYGVALGRMFFGESMFTRRTDGSKIALAHLAAQLARWEFPMIDCQMSTSHLASLGAKEIPRHEFTRIIAPLVAKPPIPGPWTIDEDLVIR
jgi:leucyl/phenylalanyl-tRNA--protein transferase